jgi:hypothetical protein
MVIMHSGQDTLDTDLNARPVSAGAHPTVIMSMMI